MSFDEILEWTMGWPWPVIVLLGVLIALGIGRVLSWEETEPGGERPSDAAAGQACVCQCGG